MYSHRQVFERCVEKRLELLDGIVAPTVYPILYCLETVSITGIRDWLEKVPSIFPVNVNQNPERCLKREIVEHNSHFLQFFQLFLWKVYAQIIFFDDQLH